jgi:hypothetical protein
METTTKSEAYPLMYGDLKPLSIIIAPAINESTAADAGEFINVTVNQPFSDHGYYILPIPIVREIFQNEGITDGAQLKGTPTSVFKDSFGADAVLFITITSWDRSYIVIAGNVTVALEYVLLSTSTNEILWSYSREVVVDTSGSSGNIIADIISTAISTAATDYIPVAMAVNNQAVKAFPYGIYHPSSGLDSGEKSVLVQAKDAPLLLLED